jgi:hypothetical protein
VGSALISAVRQVGGTFGVAVLGSVLNSAYRSRLDLAGVPDPAANAIRDNVAAGVVVAQRLGSPDLLAMVQGAFIHGMDVMLACSGGIAAVAAVLALAFLPGQRNGRGTPPIPQRSVPEPASTGQVSQLS